jgi:aminoglycoside phosphotransferase (APT) family kinase protein
MSSPLDQIRQAITRLHPETGPADDLAVLGEGFGATVLVSPDGLVIRVPRTPGAASRTRATDHVLRRLTGRLPVPVPSPLWLQEPVADLPFGAIAYPMLKGVPFEPGAASPTLADQVASLLATLHAINPGTAGVDLALVPGRADVDAERAAAMRICLPWLRRVLPSGQSACLESWWSAYEDARAHARNVPALIHGDLWYENLLVDPGQERLTGVLDWENLAYDDPAQDLATLLHAGPAFADRVLATYARLRGVDAQDLIARRAWHWGYREFSGLAGAILADNHDEIDDAVIKLRSGALRRCFEDQEAPTNDDDFPTAPPPRQD